MCILVFYSFIKPEISKQNNKSLCECRMVVTNSLGNIEISIDNKNID